MSNFHYCSLILLFCSKAANDLINRTTKRAMRITYNSDNEETLDTLLQTDGAMTIHKKNLCHIQTKHQILEWHSLHVFHLQKLVIDILVFFYFFLKFSRVKIKFITC